VGLLHVGESYRRSWRKREVSYPSPIPSSPRPISAYSAQVTRDCGHFARRKKQRPDSLQRHLENIHLNRFAEGAPVPCPLEICGGQKFESVYAWLSHASRVHKYDLHVKVHRCATLSRSTSPSAKPGEIVFVDDGETSGTGTEDSAISTGK
jgi:hypothetical protein